MENGVSSTDFGSVQFDIPLPKILSNDDEEDAAEAKLRQEQIQKNLENAFDDLVSENEEDDDDDSSNDDESNSDLNSTGSHLNNSQLLEHPDHSSFPEQSSISHDLSQVPNDSDNRNYYQTQSQEQSVLYGNPSVSESSIKTNPLAQEHPNYNFKYASAEQTNFLENQYSNPISKHSEEDVDMQQEYLKYRILYETTLQDLEQLKQREMNFTDNTNQEIKTLEMRLRLFEGEKDHLSSNLQKSQDLVSDFKRQISALQGNLSALEIQLSDVTSEKEEVKLKLESSEVTIQALEKQIRELNRSDSLSRLRNQNESIISDLKLRHQKELLNYKEYIDKLQSQLNSKAEDINSLESKVSLVQQRCEQLQIEKSELFSKLSSQLEASQKQCHQLLESGAISEVSMLKLKVKQLEEERAQLDNQNSTLREEVKSLKAELHTSEALQKITTASRKHFQQNDGQKEDNLQKELEQSLKNLRSQRSLNFSLKNELEEMKKQLPFWQEKANLFETRCNESEEKVKQLEEKLLAHASLETTALSLNENKVKDLGNKLSELQFKFHDVTEKYNQLSIEHKTIQESYGSLQRKVREMVQQHAKEKMTAIEDCRQKCLEIHESAIKTLKQTLQSKSDDELKTVCINYENKIDQFQKELKLLNEGLYESKAQYINIFEENKSLQKKLEDISKPKEREEIEAEFRIEYEKKVVQMKEMLQKENEKVLQNCLKAEVERAQKEWSKQKMVEVTNFVETTKKSLDEEFRKCLDKEQKVLLQHLEDQKTKFQTFYQENVSKLKNQFEEEKVVLTSKLHQQFTSKLENEVKNLERKHEQEKKINQQEYDIKVFQFENEIKKLKDKMMNSHDGFEELIKIKEDFLEKEKLWEREKESHLATITSLKLTVESITEMENALREKIKKYRKHIAALEKHYKDKTEKLQTQISDLQKNQNQNQELFLSIKDKYEIELQNMRDLLKGKQNSVRNSGTQTEFEVVPKQKIIDLKQTFLYYLKSISEEIMKYLAEAKSRNMKHLREAILHYHNQMSTKMSRVISKDINLQTQVKSPVECNVENTFEMTNTARNFCSTKIKNSTPFVDTHSFGDNRFTNVSRDIFSSLRQPQLFKDI